MTSNFSFSHNVFNSYISLLRQNAASCGNGLRLLKHGAVYWRFRKHTFLLFKNNIFLFVFGQLCLCIVLVICVLFALKLFTK